MRKKLLIAVGVLLVVVLIIVLNLRQSPAIEVEVEPVSRADITSKVSASGELKANRQVDISAEVLARVKRVWVKEGEMVQKGELLCELDDLQAKAALDVAEAKLEQLKRNLERAESLFARELISKENLEHSRLEYKLAQASYNEALNNHQKTKIYSPIFGKVMRVNIEEGETVILGVLNNPGTVMLTVADLSRMRAVVKVDETDLPAISIGDEAEITVDALPDSVLFGRVKKVGLIPIQAMLGTQETRDFEVEIELQEFPSELCPGMGCKAEIITAKKEGVLSAPIQATGRRKIGDREVESVFRYQDGKALLTAIETGESDEERVEILNGISEGDTVITGPYRTLLNLRDGTRVKPK
jgi:HlyD family secretion protein